MTDQEIMASGHTLSLMKWVQHNLTVASTGAYNIAMAGKGC